MNRVAEEGRKRQQYYKEENKWQERWARNQRGKGVFTDEQLRQMLEKSKFKDDNLGDDFAKIEKVEGLLPSNAEKHYSSFEKFFVGQLDKIFPPKKKMVTVTSKHQKTSEKGWKKGAGERPFQIFTTALWGSWVLFTRSIFRLPVPLMLGVVWTVVLVLASIELVQPEEPHPDSIEYQARVDQGARSSNPGLYSLKRGTIEDIQLKELAIQPAEATRSVMQRKD